MGLRLRRVPCASQLTKAAGRDRRGRAVYGRNGVLKCLALVAAITTVGIHTATARSGTHDTSKLSPQRLRALVYRSHPCLARIIDREDPSWDPTVSYGGGHNVNDSYGLGQANPGTKMARFGADWRTNPWTQLRWTISYAVGRYGSECAALAFWLRHGWW